MIKSGYRFGLHRDGKVAIQRNFVLGCKPEGLEYEMPVMKTWY